MRFSHFFLAASLIACSGDDAFDVNGEPLAPATEIEADVRSAPLEGALLRAGVYDSILDGTPVNECGLLASQLAPQPAVLEWLDDDEFTWVDGADCTVWDSLDYTCHLTYSQQMAADDVELTTTRYAVGFIVDAETLEEEQEVTVDCRGTGCDDYADYVGAAFPCEMVLETTPTWRAL